MPPRRYNSESSESNTEKSRGDRDEDWDAYDRHKHNRDARNYSNKHGGPYYDEHNRRYFERR